MAKKNKKRVKGPDDGEKQNVLKMKDAGEICKKIITYRDVSKKFREPRLKVSQKNWDVYNLFQDFSEKSEGQSQEFLPKLSLGLENLTHVMVTGLTNRSDDFFTVEKGSIPDEFFTTDIIQKILKFFLFEADAISTIGDMIKVSGLDGILTMKVGGTIKKIPRFRLKVKENSLDGVPELIDAEDTKYEVENEPLKRWRLIWEIVDMVDTYLDPRPNPSGPLYIITTTEVDWHVLEAEAKDYPEVFDIKEIEKIDTSMVMDRERKIKDRKQDRGNLDQEEIPGRMRVTLTEFWGTLLDERGRIMEKMDNVFAIVANDTHLIVRPRTNPKFDGEPPYVISTLISIPKSVWGRGFLDSTAALNETVNEAFNLILDGFFNAIKGIKQFRRGMLRDQEQVSDTIPSGTTLEIDHNAPLGAHVLEKVPTGDVPPDVMGFFNHIEDELNQTMFMNELKMGNLPQSGTKATVAMLADQSISGIFAGLVRRFEDVCLSQLLYKSWLTILQEMDDEAFSDEEMKQLIGDDKVTNALAAMTPEQRFARGANAAKFSVRGISGQLQKVREFQKLTTLLGVLSGNQQLLQVFMQEFNIGKVLAQVISSAGLRDDQLRYTEAESSALKVRAGVINKTAEILAGVAGNKGAAPAGTPGNAPAEVEGEIATTPQGPMEGNVEQPQGGGE